MINDNYYTTNSNVKYTDSFPTMYCFVCRNLDNNELEELPSGVFDNKRNLLEL